jgi:ATP/maltotriose-dependent transcriptional regulator MalT/DNA-binding SARP family transcriptional activator
LVEKVTTRRNATVRDSAEPIRLATAPRTAPGTPSWKLVPPALPPGCVDRLRVVEEIRLALRHRLTTVVAGPGFGKTTAIASLAEAMPVAWYSADLDDAALPALASGIVDSIRLQVPDFPSEIRTVAEGNRAHGPDEATSAEALASLLCETLSEHLSQDLILVVDDVQEIGHAKGAARFLQGLCRHAPSLFHVILASRKALPFSVERLRGRGQVKDVDAAALTFTVKEVKEVLGLLGPRQDPLVERFHEISGGWPAAVRLMAEALGRVPAEELLADPDLVTKRNGHLHAYLATEVLESESPDAREALLLAAHLGRASEELCDALGLRKAGDVLDDLTRRGLLTIEERNGVRWFRVSGLMRDVVLSRLPIDEARRRDLRRRAADWFRSRGALIDAMRSLQAAGDPAAVASFLTDAGGRLFDAGHVSEIIEAAEPIPEALRSPEIELWVGQAKQARGDIEGALACYRRAGGDAEQIPAALAWRMGHIHYMRGEPDLAMSAYERGRIDRAETPDEALLLSWKASLHWNLGDAEACRVVAQQAYEAALRCEDDRAIAAAHTILGMLAAIDGDRRANDAHYVQALEAATRAGDLFQVVRIRTNRASNLYEEGWFEAARGELDIAVQLGELAGFISLMPLALNNRGWTSYYRGRLEEAVADFEHARGLYQRLNSRKIAYSLEGLGTISMQRGDVALARTHFEEAMRHAEAARDVQGLVPALAGLARVLAAEDPARAVELCERAVAFGAGLGQVKALLARGWVAMTAADRDRAAELGDAAATFARERRDRIGLAEALQLEASAEDGGDRKQALLEESLRIWHELGSPLGEAQAELALAQLAGGLEGRARAEAAWQTLARLGIRRGAHAAGPLAALPEVAQPAASIRSLGGFQVLRDGVAMPASEWQSKKSRDLLKILVARRGRSLHRDRIVDALWPEEDPSAVGSRLSVALSRIRSALDPEHRFPSDHYIAGGDEAVLLNVANVDIDVERFLRLAEKGLGLVREGRSAEAVPILQTAEATYTGDFLEEDAYEDWALSLREQARALTIAVTRALAEAAAAAGDRDTAVRCYLRTLERDPYDEEAHLGLVATTAAAGHHGEARRHYRSYVAKMDDIGVEAAPFPALDRR